jgi:predicted DNA-binding transcriptional regulator AlpA
MVTMPTRLPDRYLTPEDLVRLFELPSVETVYQWRRKRIGPRGFRVGRHLRYDPTEVQAWVRSRTERAAA